VRFLPSRRHGPLGVGYRITTEIPGKSQSRHRLQTPPRRCRRPWARLGLGNDLPHHQTALDQLLRSLLHRMQPRFTLPFLPRHRCLEATLARLHLAPDRHERYHDLRPLTIRELPHHFRKYSRRLRRHPLGSPLPNSLSHWERSSSNGSSSSISSARKPSSAPKP
jgi:hypothetical protein